MNISEQLQHNINVLLALASDAGIITDRSAKVLRASKVESLSAKFDVLNESELVIA